ncbi:hypothetical protein [Bradyrhizobium lablabi]|uniref:hypothetical protein n=1 Tax=Bradyrhizobium lablabi TaxID=722472 RepID=UPI0018F8CB22|nr:hypothetical protein [Bradyrhizobium lablabi]
MALNLRRDDALDGVIGSVARDAPRPCSECGDPATYNPALFFAAAICFAMWDAFVTTSGIVTFVEAGL